jgi:hypothetical protein
MHPLVNDLSSIKDADLESKIGDLTKKFFMTHNAGLKQQIAGVLDMYKEEQAKRQQALWAKTSESQNKNLDKLININ